MSFETFYVDTTHFVRFGTEHLIVLAISVIAGFLFIKNGATKWTMSEKTRYALMLSLFMIVLQLFKPTIRLFLGNYSHKTDLPFHLCSLMPFTLYFVYKLQSRKWWAIFFFWIMAGTFQALFTPTLTDILPHYEAWRYWGVHAGVVILALFGFFAMGWKLYASDILYSGLAMNAAALIIYPFNVLANSNYFFLNAKPPGTTLYSYLPEWPWYILYLEVVLLVLFSFIFLIFRYIISPLRQIK